MLTQHYLRALCIAVIMLASCSAVSFAQGTTAPLKPLSVGTVTLYYNEYVWNGWSTYRNGPGSYHTDRHDGKGEGYFFTKVIGDTVINGKQYAIVYTSYLYTNTQKDRTGSDDYEIAYERLTDSALYQFIPGYDSQRQKTDLEREVFNIGAKEYYDFSCFSPPFSDCTTQISGDEFTISCHRPGDANFCHQSVTIKSGYGIIQTRKQNQSSSTFHFDYHYDKTQFIGAISNGKVLGDSLVLSLDTEWNILDTTMKNQVLSSNNLDNNRLKIRSQIADNTLSLKLITNIDQQITIEIFSLLGQLIYHSDCVNVRNYYPQVDINTNYWTPGLYFIRVFSKEGVSTSKILISN